MNDVTSNACVVGHMTYHYKRACMHYRLVLSPRDIQVVRYSKHMQVLMHLVHPHHGSLLPSTVHNALALVNIIHAHTAGCALSISAKPESVTHFPTSTTSAGLQCLLVGAPMYLVWFRAVSCHVWPLPCANIFCTSDILQLGGR